MKKSLLAALLVLVSCVSFSAFAKDASTAVRFQKGATSAQYQGVIKDYFVHDYVFYARKGQRLTLSVSGKHSARLMGYLFNAKLSDSVDLIDGVQPYVLPFNGKYTVRLAQYRAMARRGEVTPYTVKIAIK